MSEDRVSPGSEPKDALDRRLAGYLEWEAQQVGGARAGTEVASSIAAGRTAGRAGRNPVLVFAVAALALVAVAGAIAIVGRPPQQLVVVPSIEASVSPTAVPVTEAPTPEPTVAPTNEYCIELDSEIPYLHQVGTLPVSVTVPATPEEPWQGDRPTFYVANASCSAPQGPTLFIDAALVGEVYADACHWQTSAEDVPTAFDAAQALAKQKGHLSSEPVETMVGAFRATRIDIAPSPLDTSDCDDGTMKLWGYKLILTPSWLTQIYVAEVDGTTLVITANYRADQPAPTELIDSILASLRVDM